jgi:hypothetical protein
MVFGAGGLGRIPGLGMARRAARMASRAGGGRMDKTKDGRGPHKGLRDSLAEIADKKGVKITDLSLPTVVGETAGEIYKLLEGKGDVPLKELRESMPHKGPITQMAMGWLLKEDKLAFEITDNGAKVRLK